MAFHIVRVGCDVLSSLLMNDEYLIGPQVGCDASLEKMIEDGKYERVNQYITRYVPLDWKGYVGQRLLLICLKRPVSNDEALAAIGSMGLDSAPSGPLLAFGIKHPKIQLGFPIVGLGSCVTVPEMGGLCAPFLYAWGVSGRQLGLDKCKEGWHKGHHFLVMERVSGLAPAPFTEEELHAMGS